MGPAFASPRTSALGALEKRFMGEAPERLTGHRLFRADHPPTNVVNKPQRATRPMPLVQLAGSAAGAQPVQPPGALASSRIPCHPFGASKP